ncbi:MAG: hypothetical protein OEX11_02345 [Nitrosomonas sp.]|nr:hypothetical protein [Nitrosomonas sp.]
MSIDKRKLKLIWRIVTLTAIVVFVVLTAVFLSIGVESIAAILLAAVCAVVFWYAVILFAVNFFVPGLSEYIEDSRVERIQDEIEVESATKKTGDTEIDAYVTDYARVRDFWGKTGMILVGLFLALLYIIFGVP